MQAFTFTVLSNVKRVWFCISSVGLPLLHASRVNKQRKRLHSSQLTCVIWKDEIKVEFSLPTGRGCWQEVARNRQTRAVVLLPDKSFLTLTTPGCRRLFLRWHVMNLFSFGVWIEGVCRESREINPQSHNDCASGFCSALWFRPAQRRPEPRGRATLSRSQAEGAYLRFLIHLKISLSWKWFPCHV